MYEVKFKELGINIESSASPLAIYVPAVKCGDFVFTSGQIPVEDGQLKFSGKITKDLTLQEGQNAAKLCAINCFRAIKSVIGDLDKIDQIVKLTVFVNSPEGFTDQPKVANGASSFIETIFREKGKHSRSAVGVRELPINSAVEIEMIIKLKSQ